MSIEGMHGIECGPVCWDASDTIRYAAQLMNDETREVPQLPETRSVLQQSSLIDHRIYREVDELMGRSDIGQNMRCARCTTRMHSP